MQQPIAEFTHFCTEALRVSPSSKAERVFFQDIRHESKHQQRFKFSLEDGGLASKLEVGKRYKITITEVDE